MKPYLTFILTALAGLLIWLSISALSEKFEAWDSNLYFLVGLPLMLLTSAVAGYIGPELPWRWGVAVVSLQLAALLSSGTIGPLFLVGLVFFGFIAAICSAAAYGGAAIRVRRNSRARIGTEFSKN